MSKVIAVPIIILINTAVFVAWTIAARSQHDLQFMIQNFLVSWDSLAEGRLWTLLGSAFSHNMFWHFLLNMLVLNSFGPIMEISLGRWRFVKFYLTASIVSSLGHAVVSAWLLHQPSLPALGASGAISGIILLFSLMFPHQRILLLGLVPIPALVGSALFVGLDIWGLIAQAEGGGLPIGHGAHLGGALTGIIYYFFIIRGRRSRLSQRFGAGV